MRRFFIEQLILRGPIVAETLPLADESNTAFPEVQEQLDAFRRGELHPNRLVANLSDICRNDGEATWEALALIDRYHRQGSLNTDVFISAKTALNAIAFATPRGLEPHNRAKQSAAATEKESAGVATKQTPETARECAADAPSKSLRATAVLLDRYVLLEPIHATATATIFKAFDRKRSELSEAERFVSIKGLNATAANSAESQGLLQYEFMQSKDLSHPNILATYDCQRDGQTDFLVQALLEGQLLSRLMERLAPRRMLQAQALAIVRDIGRALAYAHEKQIMHGALNIDMVIVGSDGTVRLFGFGSNGASSAVVSARSGDGSDDDIFGLACITYELLAGQAPFAYADNRRQRRWSRIKSLSRKQWRLLEQGLQPQHARRSSPIREWVMAFVQDDAATFLPSYEYITSEVAERSYWRAAMGKFAAALLLVAAIGGGIYWLQSGAFKLPIRANSEVTRALLPPSVNESETATDMQSKNINPQNISPKPRSSRLPRNVASSSNSSAAASANMTDESIKKSTMNATTAVAATDDSAITNGSLAAQSPALLPGPAKVSFSTNQFMVANNESVARVNVALRGDNSHPVIVKWRTLPGSAKPDTDYAATTDGEVRIAPGERHAAIVVPIVHGAARQQASKWFDVEITEVSNAALSSSSTATVIIVGAE